VIPGNAEQPRLEQMEPRLLMSGEPTVGGVFAAATSIDVVADGAVSNGSTLIDAGDTDLYKFTAAARGRVSIELSALDGELDPYLQVYNAREQLVGANNNAGWDTLNSCVRRYVQAGQTYYIRAAGDGETHGQYELQITSDPVDDFGGSLAAAQYLRTQRTGAGAFAGRIHYAGDEDFRSFTATVTGLARVQMQFRGRYNALQGTLSAYDAAGNLLGSVTRDGESAVALDFSVQEGQTYHLRASGEDGTQGSYVVRMDRILAQEFVDAAEVVVAGEDQAVRAGTLVPDGSDMYKFTATANGWVHLDMTAAEGSGIDPYLEVYNTSQRRIARNDNLNRNVTDSHIRLRVREGRTYYVRVSGAEATAGGYELTITGAPRDDYANNAAMATALRVRTDGRTGAWGRVHYAGDVDYLEYTARVSGLVTLSLAAYGRNSALAGAVSVYDATGTLVTAQQAGEGAALEMSFTAVAGESYSLAVSGGEDTTGRYVLRVQPTIWQEFIDATAVDLAAWGETALTGTLGADGSTCYKFTAKADGYMRIDMAADAGSGIDSCVEVFRSNQRRIAKNDDYGSRDDSRVQFRVKAGETYYVRASAVEGTSGDYEVTFTAMPIDDAGNTLATARPRRLRSDGSGVIAGRMQYDGDVDVLKIVATVTGEMTVTMAPSAGEAGLSPQLSVCDAAGAQLAADADGDAVTEVTLDVTAGQVYYLLAADLGDGTGRYLLTVQTTPPPPAPDPEPDPDPAPSPDPDPAPAPDAPTPGETVIGYTEDFDGGTRLVVAGTDGDDVITLSYSESVTTLVSAAGTQQFSGTLDGVWIYGFGGDDVLRTDWSLAVESTIYGGDGADAIYENSQASATVYGGGGDDLIVSVGGGTDTLRGEGGTDSFWLDGADALADASSAENAASNVHRIGAFYQPYTSNPASSSYVSLDARGQDLVDPTPTSYGKGWANFADRPLFADGPDYDDIVQGYVGDCYFLAALASLCDTDPNALRQMITSLGDGTYAVRFFSAGEEVYLRLDADLPVASGTNLAYARLSGDGETWVALAEKAYCHFRYGQNTYASISGGWMSTVYREVTNATTSTIWMGGSATTLANTIATALTAGHAVTVGSSGSSPAPIVGSHAYMIHSIEGTGAGAIVTVYNPWGVDGRSYDNNYGDGLLRLNMTQMTECFTAMVICNA